MSETGNFDGFTNRKQMLIANQTSEESIQNEQSGIHSISIINLQKPEEDTAFQEFIGENKNIYIGPNKMYNSRQFNYGNSKAQIMGISIK